MRRSLGVSVLSSHPSVAASFVVLAPAGYKPAGGDHQVAVLRPWGRGEQFQMSPSTAGSLIHKNEINPLGWDTLS